jgi:hypothetical protein
MPLKFEVETLDGLDETVKPLYAKHGDKFRLAVEGIDPADELKKALAAERTEKKKAEQRARELEEAANKATEAQKVQQGQFKELYEKTQADLEKERKEKTEFMTVLQKKELEAEAMRIASMLTKDVARADLLKKETLQFLRLDTASGAVLIENGGIPIEREKLAELLKTKYPFLVDGSGASGGGAGGSKDKSGQPLYRDEMSSADKAAFIRENGQQAYLKLPKAKKK